MNSSKRELHRVDRIERECDCDKYEEEMNTMGTDIARTRVRKRAKMGGMGVNKATQKNKKVNKAKKEQ